MVQRSTTPEATIASRIREIRIHQAQLCKKADALLAWVREQNADLGEKLYEYICAIEGADGLESIIEEAHCLAISEEIELQSSPPGSVVQQSDAA